MSGIERFVEDVQSRWGMRPLFPFGQPIRIGDIGRIGEDGEWLPLDTTQDRFRVKPAGLRTQPENHQTWDHVSGRDVTFKIYAKGQTSALIQKVAEAQARAEIRFVSSNSFVFAAKNVTITTATDVSDVLQAVRRAYHLRHGLPENERWETDLAYIFAVGDADRFTALLAEHADTAVVVTGGGTVGPPVAPADLALGIKIGVSSNEIQTANVAPAPRYFYRAYRLDPSVFARWDRERERELHGITEVTEEQRVATADRLPLPTFDEAFTEVSEPAPVPA